MSDKDSKRVLRMLSAGPATINMTAGKDSVVLEGRDRGSISVTASSVRRLMTEGLVERTGTQLCLTQAGLAHRKRGEAASDQFQAQHRTMEERTVDLGDGLHRVQVNADESPISMLARRKGRDGRPLLSAREVAAGERLRSDYTRGQLIPGLGANWRSPVVSGQSGGVRGGIADLTDGALAARLRVDRALEAVGPELAGVLVDICCFLKGLELVEAERRWPARSAKLLLRTALGTLARHYEPDGVRRTGRQIVHWGADGFRPQFAENSSATGE